MGHTIEACAENILLLLSIKTTGNQEMLGAAHIACGANTTKVVNLAESDEIDLPQLVRSSRAKVVLAVGDKAYKLASSTIQKIPIIGAMTADQKANTVSYIAPPEKYLAAMHKLGRKSVAVVYSHQTSAYIRKATELAKSYGIILLRREASSPTEAIDQFNSIKSQADALWLLPDTTILTSGSAEALLRTSQEFNIPVFAFSKNYLKSGAALVIDPDREQIGKIVGEGVCSIIDDSSSILPHRDPYREIRNEAVITRLGLSKTPYNKMNVYEI
jgi:ABC-type uncharacterized transport system substrate-binding protein